MTKNNAICQQAIFVAATAATGASAATATADTDRASVTVVVEAANIEKTEDGRASGRPFGTQFDTCFKPNLTSELNSI